MRLFIKLLAAYLLIFVIYFTLVAGLGMWINNKDFFEADTTKILVRMLLPAIVVAQWYYRSNDNWLRR